MEGLKKMEKEVVKCLSFLENPVVRFVLIVVLVIYNSSINSTVNTMLSQFFGNHFVRLIVLLIIVVLGLKDPLLSLLLAIALVSVPRNEGFTQNQLAIAQDMVSGEERNMESFDNEMESEQQPEMESEEGTTDMENDTVENFESSDKYQYGAPFSGFKTFGKLGEKFHNMANKPKDGGPQGYVSFDSQSEMIGSVPQSNMVPSGEMESFHNMANSPKDGGPEGYNYKNDCTNLCSAESGKNPQCNSVATFNPELNAQGLNCPMGFAGTQSGSNF